jgi:hypothetical protein
MPWSASTTTPGESTINKPRLRWTGYRSFVCPGWAAPGTHLDLQSNGRNFSRSRETADILRHARVVGLERAGGTREYLGRAMEEFQQCLGISAWRQRQEGDRRNPPIFVEYKRDLLAVGLVEAYVLLRQHAATACRVTCVELEEDGVDVDSKSAEKI